MTKQEITKLWKEIQKDNKESKQKLVGIYLSRFPHSSWITQELSKENLHVMYLQLTNN